MQSVLVTGGAGYVGSHVCKALAGAGYQPVSYDDLSTGHRDLVRWGPLEEGDLGDGERLSRVIGRHRPVAVLHFAAASLVGDSVRDPAATYRANVAGSLGLLDAMRRHGVEAMVYSSSCATYGADAPQPMNEDTPQQPINPYGWSKLMTERMLADHGAAYGLQWAALRYFNAAGADPEGETGEDHRPETHLIPRALMAAAGTLPHLDVFGADWPTADGTCVRDYVHVSDLARWHVAALDHLLTGRGSLRLNLGTGRGHSVREVIAAAERATGRAVPIRIAPRRAGDPAVLVADCTRATAVLGSPPVHTELDDIVGSAWRFMERRGCPSHRR
ncbi:UDP-glucose 4-epimerase GalE [Magnetospirillum sp. UT-4]|uniref:UDP-glucose 4-epimerase GalE n=1 Tax=Magnetospirillum sp. UT-4 TaxID=2681467 RepID=UPI001384753E|nr:UDP-glucose 4-epimerase GalE [Magnetospirillum sp. UT-4]CAA7615240.1 UDP-glucose 4-epimerase [Magnetospirillum sp. UT-4]